MTLSDLASLGNVISSLGVLVSLVYLGIQTRQNSKHTQALVSQGRVAQVLSSNHGLAEKGDLANIVRRGTFGEPDMTADEGYRFYIWMLSAFMTVEDHYRQYKAGLIDAARHQGLIERMTGSFRMPGYRAQWSMQRNGFDADFRGFMDDLVAKAKAVGPYGDFGEVWRAAVAAERGPMPGVAQAFEAAKANDAIAAS